MNGRTNSSDITIQEINYGALIPLEAPTNLVLTPLNARVDITWTDPVDKVASPGGEDVALWDRTVIIRKAGSAPTGPDDGELIYTETTRNQHQYDVYSDTNNVVNNTVYYYAVYAYTQMDVPSEPISGNCKPIAGTPVYRGELGMLPNNRYVGDHGGSFYNYAIYAGGVYNTGYNTLWGDVVYSYDESLTENKLTNLSSERDAPSHAHTTSQYLIAGGRLGVSTNVVDVYDLSLTHSGNAPSLSSNRSYGGCGHYRGYAVFAGGEYDSDTVYSNVDAFDDSLTRRSLTSLNTANVAMGTSTNDNHIIFAGGEADTIDAYNSSLTRLSPSKLSKLYRQPGAASIENYNVFIMTGNIPAEAYDASLSKVFGGTFPAPYNDVDLAVINLGSYILIIKTSGIGSGQYIGLFDPSLTYSPFNESDLPTDGFNGMSYYGVTKINNKYALFSPNMYYFEAV